MISLLGLAMLVWVSITLPNGNMVPAKHIREHGGEEYVEEVSSLATRAAKEEGVSRFHLAALLITESALGLREKSFNGSSRSIAQLNTQGKYWKAYRNACKAVPSECLYAAIRVSAIALHEAQVVCGEGPSGYGRYRSRRCLRRDLEWKTHHIARWLQVFAPAEEDPSEGRILITSPLHGFDQKSILWDMSTTNTAKRERNTGRYTYEGKWDRVCARCGSTLGRHDAEAPHANDDATVGPDCPGFKPLRASK